VTQRVVGRLASAIPNARAIHLPSAGHMLAITHAAELIPDIADHIADADERAARITQSARPLERTASGTIAARGFPS
jgi:hypothetical protein